MQQLSPRQLADWLADASRGQPLLLDVRESWEYELCHLAGSTLMPMGAVPGRIGEIEPEREVVVICHHGRRSLQVAMFLERAGFSAVRNLTGGIDGWARDVDPGMHRY